VKGLRGWLKLTWIEMKLFVRNPLAAFFAIAFPLLLLLMYGSIYGNSPLPYYSGHGMVDVYAPAYIGMVIATNGLMTLPGAITHYRESGVLRRLQATPLRPLAILLAEFAGNFVMTAAGAVLIIVAAKLVYDVHFYGNPAAVVGAFVLCSASFLAFGFMLASLLPTVQSAQMTAYLLFFPQLFLSGAAYPTQLMPSGLRTVAEYLPMTYVVKLLQGLWLGDSIDAHIKDIIVLATLMVVSMAVSSRVFRWR
jgi:ABC-2 type transport system permease protein